MKIRAFSVLGVLVVVSMVLLMTMPASAAGKGNTLRVGPGQEYETIQAAVDDAKQGAKILVYPDYYEESVMVTTNNLKVIAQDSGVTVYSLTEGVAAFTVYADHVVIRGFDELTGTDCTPGIQFRGSYNTFAENIINPGSCPGINALVCRDPDGGSNFNRIESNTIVHADLGVVIVASEPDALNVGNIIQNNTVNRTAQNGIVIANGIGFTISGNSIAMSPFGDCIAVFADNNVAQGYHRITDNTVTRCVGNGGIALYAEDHTTLSHNHISSNEVSLSYSVNGIYLGADPDATLSDNLILDNLVYHNYNGIYLGSGADKNRILNNEVQTNSNVGVAVAGNYNLIVHNWSWNNGTDLEDWGVGNKWRNNTVSD